MNHEDYARGLLNALLGESTGVRFEPLPTKSRNAARAMTAILCGRLAENSNDRPRRLTGTTYAWNDGVFNSRNISDRRTFWTNIRRKSAEEAHSIANSKPVAYLMACSAPEIDTVLVWAIPEPVLFESLKSLPPKKDGTVQTLEIHNQKIKSYEGCPDLTKYSVEIPIARRELALIKASREVDALVKSDPQRALNKVAKRLAEKGSFDPTGIKDARAKALRSIVLRQGQPEFREELLTNYNNACAVSGCNVKAVLEAAHIIPFRGPQTNHPSNGILLRADIHTLFDLKLIAIDPESMTLLVSRRLMGTCYESLGGTQVTIPKDQATRPSREALELHRKESML